MALVGPKMGLAIWNLLTDKFNHNQLADDFLKIEFHDHTPGRGVQIPTAGIKDGAITAAKLAPGSNAVEDGSITTPKFAALPAVKVYKDATTAATNSAYTTLTFNNERFDSTNSMHDDVTNPERLTAPVAGKYLITASVTINAVPSGGQFALEIYKNGTTNVLARQVFSTTAVAGTITTFAQLAASDYVIVRARNDSGGLLTISAGSATSESLNDFGMVWVAP